ncbi:MAG: site-2 protease family protein [Clostridiales bacterium]|nr:site-2 protease family protein [Clostridiales bacterium]
MANIFSNFDLYDLLMWASAVILALTFHEFSHAQSAFWLGDPTAQRMGRLTLNPIKHLDPIGAVMLLFFHFGWAKAVPFNPLYFRMRDKRKAIMLVSLAGPVSNLLFALVSVFLWAIMVKIKFLYGAGWSGFAQNTLGGFVTFLGYLCHINIILAVFNLLPIPPLDGSKVMVSFLPWRWAEQYYQYERYGFLILIILIFTGLFGMIISPAVKIVMSAFENFAKWIVF